MDSVELTGRFFQEGCAGTISRLALPEQAKACRRPVAVRPEAKYLKDEPRGSRPGSRGDFQEKTFFDRAISGTFIIDGAVFPLLRFIKILTTFTIVLFTGKADCVSRRDGPRGNDTR